MQNSDKKTRDVISVIIPVHNRKDVTLSCLSRLYSFEDTRYRLEVTVVDDGSSDGTESAVRALFPQASLVKGDGNLWWAGGVNEGLRHVSRDGGAGFILLMNDDNGFDKSSVDILYETLSRKGAKTVVGSAALDAESGRVYRAGHWRTGFLKRFMPLYEGTRYEELPEYLECDSLSSRFVMFPSQLIADAGIFDAKRFPHHFSDLDYFYRAKCCGYTLLVASKSVVSTSINRNYIQYMRHGGLRKLLRSYLDIRYPNNLSLIFNESFSHRGVVQALLLLGWKLASNLKVILHVTVRQVTTRN